MRQAETPLRTFGVDVGIGALVPPQPAGWAHLVVIRSGVAILRCAHSLTHLVPHVGAWIPDGVPYALEFRSRCSLRIVYSSALRHSLRTFSAVGVNPLLDELIERATTAGYLSPNNVRDAHLLAVIDDELAALPGTTASLSLVLPRDAKVRTSVERALAQSDLPVTIGKLASAAHMSLRTFERRFRVETGLTPRAWLRRARLGSALEALASGASITEASLACGYSSLSAFIAAYRALFGTTPGRTVLQKPMTASEKASFSSPATMCRAPATST
jgi:AraC-like DNA-binding protein